jgi:nitrogen fixation NifU-like protein
MNPRNVGEIENADGVGKVGNKICGDVMYVYIKVGKGVGRNKDKKVIKNVKFKTLGCAAAIATSDMIADLAKNKTLEEAKKITRKDVSKALGNLPPIKMHCSNLASEALKKAIENYEKKMEGGENGKNK